MIAVNNKLIRVSLRLKELIHVKWPDTLTLVTLTETV